MTTLLQLQLNNSLQVTLQLVLKINEAKTLLEEVLLGSNQGHPSSNCHIDLKTLI